MAKRTTGRYERADVRREDGDGVPDTCHDHAAGEHHRVADGEVETLETLMKRLLEIGFVTPHDRHTGADIAILNARKLVYKRAHRAHPERWTGEVRAWKRPDQVRLHPDRPAIALMQRKGGVAA